MSGDDEVRAVRRDGERGLQGWGPDPQVGDGSGAIHITAAPVMELRRHLLPLGNFHFGLLLARVRDDDFESILAPDTGLTAVG